MEEVQADLVLAACGERLACDIRAPRLRGSSFVLTLRKALAQIILRSVASFKRTQNDDDAGQGAFSPSDYRYWPVINSKFRRTFAFVNTRSAARSATAKAVGVITRAFTVTA